MPDRILTSHAGSLPRPEELVALNLKRGLGELDDEAGYQAKLTQAVADVVAQQRELGIDLVNDGEFGHSMGHRYDYGPWWTYVFQRLGGLELVTDGVLDIKQAPGKPGELSLASFVERRDWLEFSDAYGDPNSGAALPNPDIGTGAPVCRGPITYTGQRGARPRHRQPQGGARCGRRAGGLHERRGPGELRAVRQRVLQGRRGAHVRVRGRDARGVQGDHRGRAHPAARRSGDRRELGPDQPRALRRGLPAASRCCASRRSTTRSGGCRRTGSASTSAGAAGTART